MTRTAYLLALALAACSSSGDDNAGSDGGSIVPINGAQCDDFSDCDSSEECVSVPKSFDDYAYDEPGTCGPFVDPPDGAGEPCLGEGLDPDGDCPDGYTCLYVLPTDMVGICDEVECDSDDDCEDPALVCDRELGLCSSPECVGVDICGLGNECMTTFNCPNGLVCVLQGTSGTCQLPE